MTHKNFSQEISGLLDRTSQNNEKMENETAIQLPTRESLQSAITEQQLIKNSEALTHIVTTVNHQAHSLNTTRTSIYLRSDFHRQLKALAYWERCSATSLFQEALELLFHSRGTAYVEEVVQKHNVLEKD